jgi:hypothetical protein
MRDNNVEEVKLSYFGTADPSSYGINYTVLPPEELYAPEESVYAISIHRIDAVKWADRYTPVARLGNSIFIYRFPKNS